MNVLLLIVGVLFTVIGYFGPEDEGFLFIVGFLMTGVAFYLLYADGALV